jgi:DNA-binding transcriptional regulator YiaG
MPARPIKEERQRWYVYLLLKHFKGDTAKFSRTMDISKRSIEQWKEHHYEDMKEFIKKERKADRNGGEVPFDERETPTPEALQEECLKRMEDAIKLEQDPAKLARAFDTLSKIINPAEKGKEKKSIAEVVVESIKK